MNKVFHHQDWTLYQGKNAQFDLIFINSWGRTALAWREIQTTSFKIKTRVAKTILYDDNRYVTPAPTPPRPFDRIVYI